MTKLALMQKGSSKHEFPHWSEVLSVLTYASNLDIFDDVEFCHYRKISQENEYVDPLDRHHSCFTKKDFNSDDPLIVNGSLHLETSPMSYGTIPYRKFHYKIAMEHTTGYSPWDFLQMVDLAAISRDDPDAAGNCYLRFLMNEKFYNRFMNVDWTDTQFPSFETYKSKIHSLMNSGHIKLERYEPSQYWLDKVVTDIIPSQNICVVLNWCNFKKASLVREVVDRCVLIHKVTGLDIDLKLHAYCKPSFLKYFEQYDFIHILDYFSSNKYEIMDKYETYFVDGTGFGYECAYRNYKNHRNVNIFYFNGLASESDGFGGIIDLGAIPEFNLTDFVDGQRISNFNQEIIDESFPHCPGFVPDDVMEIVSSNYTDMVR